MTLRFLLASSFLMLPCSLATASESQKSVASLDHVAIYVRNVDVSTAFYKNLFGFREVKAPFPIARWLMMGNGLMLHIVSGRTEPLKNSKWDHFAVSCGDMAKQIAELDAKQISWTNMQGKHEVQSRPDGIQQIFVHDPDGYWIEINDSLKSR